LEKRVRLPFIKTVALFAFTLVTLASAHAEQRVTVKTADGPREAIISPAQKPGPNPTIIILHGATISAERMVRASGFVEAAAAHGFTAVFPEGKAQRWNDARNTGRSNVDDVGFLNALAHQLIDAKIADPARLYLAGISNGGMMAFTMICEPQSPFAGIATVISSMPSNLESTCRPRRPLAVVMMNGTSDPMVPFSGGKVGFLGRHGNVLGVERTAEIFAKAEGCGTYTQAMLPKSNNGEKTRVKLLNWTGCAPGSSLRLYKILGGGHQIPGGPTFIPFVFGSPNHDIRAANEILAAFSGS
jgi:polyhydroxybutyrate depolymerase